MALRKIAFFVEGYTEQQFIKKLLEELFDQRKIAIEIKSIRGGNRVATSYSTILSADKTDQTQFYILIYNCNGDNAIKSNILEQRLNLIEAGYCKIVGLRDVYPISKSDIFKLRSGLTYGIPQKDLPISFVLSVMEIEGWFLAEETHFQKINNLLTVDVIRRDFGIDLSSANTEDILEAAILLKRIYQTVGMSYRKEASSIDRTINALDFTNIYLNVRSRNKSLDTIITECELLF